jgi:hypothetical protein
VPQTLKKLLDAPELLDAYIQYAEMGARHTDAKLTAVAWEVAVISPGFLGLLWNFETLSKHTALDATTILLLFRLAELCFLGGIIVDLIVYGFLIKLRGNHEWLGRNMQSMKLYIGHVKFEQAVSPQLAALVKKLHNSATTSAEDLVSSVPWMVGAAIQGSAYFAVVGYALIGVILATLQ